MPFYSINHRLASSRNTVNQAGNAAQEITSKMFSVLDPDSTNNKLLQVYYMQVEWAAKMDPRHITHLTDDVGKLPGSD